MPAILPASGQRIINLPSSFIRNQESGIRNQESVCVKALSVKAGLPCEQPVDVNQAGLISITPATG
jgi:hypothetical protein